MHREIKTGFFLKGFFFVILPWFLLLNHAWSCVGINQVPITITKPGDYCLLKDLSVMDPSASAILIQSDNVNLDLQGHILKSTALVESRSSGIESYGHSNIVVKNGTIKNFMYGVRIQEPNLDKLKNNDPSAAHNIEVVNVKFEFNTFRGAALSARNSAVVKSKFYSTGGTRVYQNSFSMAIEILGQSCNITQNIIRDVYPVGVGEGVGISISSFGDGCKVQGNTISNHFLPALGRTFGMWMSHDVKDHIVISQNTIVGFSYAGNLGRSQIILSNNQFNQIHCANFFGMETTYYRNKKICYEEDTKMDSMRAAKGDPNFLYKLGMQYREGLWMKRNLQKAYYYLNLAAGKGSIEARRVSKLTKADLAAENSHKLK